MVIYPRPLTGNQVMISFAQTGEDVLIDRVFRKQTGFFIDAGAHHPVGDSVTKYFSLQGWQGINIEPDPEYFTEILRDRPREINLRCAVGRARGEVPFHQLPNRGMSTISEAQLGILSPETRAGARTFRVPMRTLADICEEFVKGEIDFLKIDVEGAEGDVIAGADWKRFRPRLLVIEATKPLTSEPNCETWEPYLLEQGYLLRFMDGINRYYLRREDDSLSAQLSVPVNVLDTFVHFRELNLRQQNEALQGEVQRLRSLLAAPRK